jgi:hypothetical protein
MLISCNYEPHISNTVVLVEHLISTTLSQNKAHRIKVDSSNRCHAIHHQNADAMVFIEIINNSRGGIEVKNWERN